MNDVLCVATFGNEFALVSAMPFAFDPAPNNLFPFFFGGRQPTWTIFMFLDGNDAA